MHVVLRGLPAAFFSPACLWYPTIHPESYRRYGSNLLTAAASFLDQWSSGLFMHKAGKGARPLCSQSRTPPVRPAGQRAGGYIVV
jgi:hypothetical protein